MNWFIFLPVPFLFVALILGIMGLIMNFTSDGQQQGILPVAIFFASILIFTPYYTVLFLGAYFEWWNL